MKTVMISTYSCLTHGLKFPWYWSNFYMLHEVKYLLSYTRVLAMLIHKGFFVLCVIISVKAERKHVFIGICSAQPAFSLVHIHRAFCRSQTSVPERFHNARAVLSL